MGLQYNPSTSTLQLAMYKVRLPQVEAEGELYLKTRLKGRNSWCGGEGVTRCKASQDRAVLDFSRQSIFTLKSMESGRLSIVMEIKRSRGLGLRNRVVRALELGLGASEETGRSHWAQARARPGARVFMWHRLVVDK